MEQGTVANQSSGLLVIPQSESTLTRMRKMIPSPRGKRKSTGSASSDNRIFGAALEDVLKKSSAGADIPFIVERICTFIEQNGLQQEGIFRVNGNMRVVEKLKNAFDKNGDANLEESGDIMAVAGLLKLFLRELAEPVIPEDLHPIFVQAHRDCREEKDLYMKIIQDLLYRIPNPNYALLKYLCNFLVTISRSSDVNKMTPIALAIVFGPNLFRCSDGLEGLRDQAHVNAILALFIDEYYTLFQERGNFFSTSNSLDSPKSSVSETESPKRQKPARPPPPKFKHSFSAPANTVDSLWSPSDDLSPLYDPTDPLKKRHGILDSVQENTAKPSPGEPLRSGSPTNPITISSNGGRRMVESTIRDAVKEHLFGPSFVSSSTESDTQVCERSFSPDTNGDLVVSVRERVRKLDSDSQSDNSYKLTSSNVGNNAPKTAKRRTKSGAFDVLENSDNTPGVGRENTRKIFSVTDGEKGQGPGQAEQSKLKTENSSQKSSGLYSKSRNLPTGFERDDDDVLKFVQNHSSAPLKSLTTNRAPGPKNRRKPSLRRPVSADVSSLQPQTNQVLYRVTRSTSEKDKSTTKNTTFRSSVQVFYEGDQRRNSSPIINDSQISTSYVTINKKGMVSRSPRSAANDEHGETLSPTSSVTTTDSVDSLRFSGKQSKDLTTRISKNDCNDNKLHVKVPRSRKSRSVENLLDLSVDGSHERTRSLSPVTTERGSVQDRQNVTSPNTSIWTTDVTPLRPLSPLTIDTTINVQSPRSPKSSRSLKSPRKSNEVPSPELTKQGLLKTVKQDTKGPVSPNKETPLRTRHPSVDRLKKHCRDQPVVPPLDLFRLQKEEGDMEEAQPSPRARFDRVYNDGPVRSPRSPSVSKIDFDSQYDSPPHPPNHHRNVDWLEKRQESVPIIEMPPKELKRRIEALKKIIGNFENAFEERHGRRPTSSEKSPVQKYIAELGRAKKQLKEMMDDLKDFPELLNETAVPAGEGGIAPNLRDIQLRNAKPSKEETLSVLIKKLQDKRLAAGRPEEIEVMTSDQLLDEKLAVQKALLQYESVHGRPSTKEDKTLMRPLYERYRKIKRLIATGKIAGSGQSVTDKVERKLSESRDRTSKDLEPIIEGVQFDGFQENESSGNIASASKGEGSGEQLSDQMSEDHLNDTFAVTSRVPDRNDNLAVNSGSNASLDEAVLHEATLDELLEQQRLAKKSKKKLGKKLKNFEDDFYTETGRKVQKEDRVPMETEYRDYKLIKARLRLLEALISKKESNQTI